MPRLCQVCHLFVNFPLSQQGAYHQKYFVSIMQTAEQQRMLPTELVECCIPLLQQFDGSQQQACIVRSVDYQNFRLRGSAETK